MGGFVTARKKCVICGRMIRLSVYKKHKGMCHKAHIKNKFKKDGVRSARGAGKSN